MAHRRHRRHYHLKHKRHYKNGHPHKRGYHLKHKRKKPHYKHKRRRYHLKHKRHYAKGLHRKFKGRKRYSHKRGYHLKHPRKSRKGLTSTHTHTFAKHSLAGRRRHRTMIHNWHVRHRHLRHLRPNKTIVFHHHGSLHVHKMRNAVYGNRQHWTGRR